MRLRFVGKYARFENMEDQYNSGGGDFNPNSANAGMSMNRGFDESPRTITLGSNMNNVPDEDFNGPDETPF